MTSPVSAPPTAGGGAAAVMDAARIAAARTLLFVPGDRPDRFAKAEASGADGIVVDLEDGVAPRAKDAARRHVRAWRAGGGAGLVRINGPGTPWFDDDIAALGGQACAVMLPKAAGPAQVRDVLAVLPAGSCAVPIVESAAGVLQAAAIAAVEGVVRLAFGNGDLGAQLGVDPADQLALGSARALVVLGSAAGGLASPLDGVTTAVADDTVLRVDVEHARRVGFTGKLCVHPRQVPLVHSALAPTADELRWARQVVAAGADEGVALAAGHLIDKPIVERARLVLARAPARERGSSPHQDAALHHVTTTDGNG